MFRGFDKYRVITGNCSNSTAHANILYHLNEPALCAMSADFGIVHRDYDNTDRYWCFFPLCAGHRRFLRLAHLDISRYSTVVLWRGGVLSGQCASESGGAD